MATMGDKRIFIDTNVLIYATNASSPWQNAAIKAIEKAKFYTIEIAVSQQVLREYLAAATRNLISKSDVNLQAIIENVHTFQSEFTVLGEDEEVLKKLIELIQLFPTAGKQVHDANIVAIMLVHGITNLLTHNVEDFKRFSEKIQVIPLEKWVQSE